jgi:hypothetical protein
MLLLITEIYNTIMGSVIIKLKSRLNNTKEDDMIANDYYEYYNVDKLGTYDDDKLLILYSNLKYV